MEEQLKSARIKHALQLDDRIDARQRMAAAAVRTDAAVLVEAAHTSADSRVPAQQQPDAGHEHHQQQQQQLQNQGQPDDESELQRLRQQRLRQLQAQSAVQQEQRQEGFGVLNTVPESSVLVRTRLGQYRFVFTEATPMCRMLYCLYSVLDALLASA